MLQKRWHCRNHLRAISRHHTRFALAEGVATTATFVVSPRRPPPLSLGLPASTCRRHNRPPNARIPRLCLAPRFTAELPPCKEHAYTRTLAAAPTLGGAAPPASTLRVLLVFAPVSTQKPAGCALRDV